MKGPEFEIFSKRRCSSCTRRYIALELVQGKRVKVLRGERPAARHETKLTLRAIQHRFPRETMTTPWIGSMLCEQTLNREPRPLVFLCSLRYISWSRGYCFATTKELKDYLDRFVVTIGIKLHVLKLIK